MLNLNRLKSWVVVLFVCMAFGNQAIGAQRTLTEKEKGERALQLINHFSTVLYRITDSRDLALLELEYDRISQENIYLDVIEDEETISIIQQIMTYITKQRLNSEEREKLQKWLKEDLVNAVFSTCPNPTGLISANPKVIATVTCQFAFSWFFHYMGERKRLQRDFEKQVWELDKDKATFLNERNMKLLEMYWHLVKKYDIMDAYRITIPEIRAFVEYADKDDNENRVLEKLCLEEKKYRKFPEYWYRRGRAAEALGKRDAAIGAYRQFQAIHLQFLRKDHMAAEVALNLAKLLLEAGDYKKADMMKQLGIIENNVNAIDWTYLHFCGSVYMTLGEYQLAYQVLGKAVKEQEHLLSFEYNKFIETLKDEGDIDFLDFMQPSSYQLMMCRSAYLQAYSKAFRSEELGRKFSEICDDKMTPGFEAMTYCNPSSHLCNNMPVELWTKLYSCVAYPDGSIDFLLPMTWFYLGNEMMIIDPKMKFKEKLSRSLPVTLKAFYANEAPEVFTEDVDDREFRYKRFKKSGKESFWVNVEIPFKHKYIAKRKVTRFELTLPLRDLSVRLVYLPGPGDLQLFPKKRVSYHPTLAIINGIEYRIGTPTDRQIGAYEAIGKSLKDFFKNK